MFPLVSKAIARVVPVERLRWIAFGHVESDDCGAMNEFLAAAPHAQVAHGAIGCMVSLDDLCDRPPRKLADGEVIDLGGKRVPRIDTPHVPHNREARVLFQETTKTLFCGDLFTPTRDGPPLTDADVVGPAHAATELFQAMALSPVTAKTPRRLAAIEPQMLALMHGSSTRIRCSASLLRLADAYELRIQQARGEAAMHTRAAGRHLPACNQRESGDLEPVADGRNRALADDNKVLCRC